MPRKRSNASIQRRLAGSLPMRSESWRATLFKVGSRDEYQSMLRNARHISLPCCAFTHFVQWQTRRLVFGKCQRISRRITLLAERCQRLINECDKEPRPLGRCRQNSTRHSMPCSAKAEASSSPFEKKKSWLMASSRSYSLYTESP
jgi:hypothetical protein